MPDSKATVTSVCVQTDKCIGEIQPLNLDMSLGGRTTKTHKRLNKKDFCLLNHTSMSELEKMTCDLSY